MTRQEKAVLERQLQIASEGVGGSVALAIRLAPGATQLWERRESDEGGREDREEEDVRGVGRGCDSCVGGRGRDSGLVGSGQESELVVGRDGTVVVSRRGSESVSESVVEVLERDGSTAIKGSVLASGQGEGYARPDVRHGGRVDERDITPGSCSSDASELAEVGDDGEAGGRRSVPATGAQ